MIGIAKRLIGTVQEVRDKLDPGRVSEAKPVKLNSTTIFQLQGQIDQALSMTKSNLAVPLVRR